MMLRAAHMGQPGFNKNKNMICRKKSFVRFLPRFFQQNENAVFLSVCDFSTQFQKTVYNLFHVCMWKTQKPVSLKFQDL